MQTDDFDPTDAAERLFVGLQSQALFLDNKARELYNLITIIQREADERAVSDDRLRWLNTALLAAAFGACRVMVHATEYHHASHCERTAREVFAKRVLN